MNTLIRLLYAILIAVAIVAFVGVGITTFYPGPKAPDYPTSMPAQKGDSAAESRAQTDYQDAYKQYQDDNQAYSRNVSIIVTVLAAAIVAGGLFVVRKRSDIISEGVALGGIGNSVYGIVTASIADDRVMRFAAVTVFLASALVIVYVQFNNRTPSHKRVGRKS